MSISPRLAFPILAASSLAITAAPSGALAQVKYPTKPIRVVIATTAGSQPDMLARMIGQKMSETWGQPVVVDNRPGAAGTLAAHTVAKATPDGHTLLYAPPNFAISAVLQPTLPYDPVKDFIPTAHVGISTNILVASPAVGARSVKEFIAIAKSQPGKLIIASSPAGSAGNLSGVRFNLAAGIKAIHVAYKGSPEATIEVLAGRATYHIGTMGVTLPFIKEGKLTALAVTSPNRAPVLPDVPTLGEILAEFKRPETSHGILVPAGTPRATVEQINHEVVRALNLPEVRERLGRISYVVAPSTPEEYAKLLHAQIEGLASVVRDAGLRPK